MRDVESCIFEALDLAIDTLSKRLVFWFDAYKRNCIFP